jgi:hypothetical protein
MDADAARLAQHELVEIAFVDSPYRTFSRGPFVVIDVQVGNEPDLAADVAPAPMKRIVLAPPQPIPCAVIEQINRLVVSRPVTQLGIALHKTVNAFLGDFQKAGRKT